MRVLMNRVVRWSLLAVTASLVWPVAARAQTVSFELMTGSAYNVPTPLTIRQDGFPDLNLSAHYRTRPFGPFAPYYSWRVRLMVKHQPWELQLVHHRLFLSNTTPEVQRFDVHYGYNYVLLGRAWATHGFLIHASAGVIVPNPESIVRGKELNTRQPGALRVSYSISGVGGGLSVSRNLVLSRHWFLLGETGALFGRATVPVVDGKATVPNVSLHARVGIGVVF
jgi:hypothetical protein